MEPKSLLISYLTLEASEPEMIQAGWQQLQTTHAHCVFVSNPTQEKNLLAILKDGSWHRINANQHWDFIQRMQNLKWYQTEIVHYLGELLIPSTLKTLLTQIIIVKEPYKFGTVAYRLDKGFLTTTRGKRGDEWCRVFDIDHRDRKVQATQKATLNAPFLDALFTKFPTYSVILHGHKDLNQPQEYLNLPYFFEGTHETIEWGLEEIISNEKFYLPEEGEEMPETLTFNVQRHGYYTLAKDENVAAQWLNTLNLKSL